MEQTTLATDAFLANATSNLFHRAKKAESISKTSSVPVPEIQNGELRNVLEQGAQLIQDYASLKTEFLDRSDRALWQLLSKVFDYVLQINASVQKRNVKSDLLAKIKRAKKNNRIWIENIMAIGPGGEQQLKNIS